MAGFLMAFMARFSLLLSLLATLFVGVLVHRAALSYFAAEELAKSEGQLSLYRSTVVAELERHSHLTHVLAQDSFVIDAVEGGGTGVLNARLKDFASRAGLDAIYLMSELGVTIAASNYGTPQSFVGQNYAFRPYFVEAMAGGQGRFYAIGATTGLPGFFLADAVQDRAGHTAGVLALKKSFLGLEDSWRGAGEDVILANEDGVVLLASDPAWLYRTLTPLSGPKKAAIAAARQFPGQALEPLDWVQQPDARAVIAGDVKLHLVANDLPRGWQLHYFASDDRAVARSWLATAAVVFLASALVIVFQVQRAQRIGRALRRAEQEEAQLRESNALLAVEIAERRSTQLRLQAAQKDLAQVSRLAALGQLAASVTHELGQPIAAMRNHLAAAEMAPTTVSDLGQRMAGLVARMEGITRQLKFFATSGGDTLEVFDLRVVLEAGLELVAPNLEAGQVAVHRDWPRNAVYVRGNQLRLEQVATNILRNACDAMEDTGRAAEIDVLVRVEAAGVVFEVADRGHGLAGAALTDLQAPFVTTRDSGRGMGLGLAISASIVKDHAGKMTARERDGGGAVFSVTLPLVEGSIDE